MQTRGGGARRGRAEGRQERSRNSDRVGQKGLNTLGNEEYVFSMHIFSREKNHISQDWKIQLKRMSYIWQKTFTFAQQQIVLAKQKLPFDQSDDCQSTASAPAVTDEQVQ